MLKLKFQFLKFFYKLKYRKTSPPIVRYWMKQESIEAKLMKQPEGHMVLQLDKEDYPFPGHPRGVLLYGPMSPLKHVIKNRVFNDSWALLEQGEDPTQTIKTGLDEAYEILDKNKYDIVPFHALLPSIKELWRAMSVVEEKYDGYWGKAKELICFILQEDDSYRMRFQWTIKFFWRKPTIKDFDYALSMLQEGEIMGDMKERQMLFRRVLMATLENPQTREAFNLLLKEVDWKKLRLTKADKYFFRAKWFRVDYPEFTY